MRLFWKLLIGNAIVVAAALAVVALSPVTVSYPINTGEALVLLLTMAAIMSITAVLTRSALHPLSELRAAMDGVHGPHGGRPAPVIGNDEVAAVATAYNEMLVRLAEERERAARAAIGAQEAERSRVGRELHDEVGQTLTFLLLQIKILADKRAPEGDDEIRALGEQVRTALDEVRAISARLRPGALEDIGLGAAVRSLGAQIRENSSLTVDLGIDPLPDLSHEQELVIYRVAQEALTNVVRHAQASTVSVRLRTHDDTVHLEISDDGSGTHGPPSTGLTGMAERAGLVHAQLDTYAAPGRGTTVTLAVPTNPPA